MSDVVVRVRRVQKANGPKLGQSRDAETTEHRVASVDSGHFDVYPCVGCGAPLMSRAARPVVSRHGGTVCPRCPVSGLIASLAEETRIPGFFGLGHGDIADPENGSSISLKTQGKRKGFSGTTQRGGRPALSEEERRRHERDRKRRQRGISEVGA